MPRLFFVPKAIPVRRTDVLEVDGLRCGVDACCPRLHEQSRRQSPSALVLMCGSFLQFPGRVRPAAAETFRRPGRAARAGAVARQARRGGVYRWSYECGDSPSRRGSPHTRATAAGRAYERRAPTPSREDLTLRQRGSISRAGVSERVCRAPSSATRGEKCYTCEWICLSTECQVSLGERVSFIQRTRAGTWELQTAEIV